MKAPTIHQPRLLLEFHHLDLLFQLTNVSMSHLENHWIISLWSEETAWVENDRTGVQQWTFIIHKDNNDIAYPWSETWHLLDKCSGTCADACISEWPPGRSFHITIYSKLKGNPPSTISLYKVIKSGTLQGLFMPVNGQQTHTCVQTLCIPREALCY